MPGIDGQGRVRRSSALLRSRNAEIDGQGRIGTEQ